MINNKCTLVLLAAGIGSRYGGLKQLDKFTPQGDTIIDFSIYSALKAGFNKFVFIIRKSLDEEFKALFEKKLKGKAEVRYVYQELDCVPDKYVNPKRTKPWGTGHALLMAEDVVKENFAIINADDFYGQEAFVTMFNALVDKDKNSFDFSTIAYLLENTVSEHGYVSRGECTVSKNNFLNKIVERKHIELIKGKTMLKDSSGKFIPIDGKTIISMNFWGFTPRCFEFGNQLFEKFLENNKTDLEAEFFLPSIVSEILKSKIASVEVLKSDAKWFGVTYKKDKPIVKKAIQELRDKGIYPKNLWSND